MKYGLTEKETELIKGVFIKNPFVECAFIYGSRVKNTFAKTADIDLAVILQKGTEKKLGKLKADLDDLSIIYETDLTDEAEIQPGGFKDEYEHTKQVFYIKGWKMTTLGEVAVLNYGKGLNTKNRNTGIVPVYGSGGITGLHNKAFVSEEGYIIGRKGTVGSIYYSPVPFFPIDTVYYCTKKDIKLNFKYFYYLLKILNLDRLNFDSAVPGLSRFMAYSLIIHVPENEAEQRAIATVLSSLDDKIELLCEQNKTLEATAQTIFKEWFVNFNFPGATGKMIDSEMGEIPEGWRVGKLSELANFLNGLALQKYPPESSAEYLPVIKIKELNSGISEQTDKASARLDKKYIVEDGDVLFSWSGSLIVDIWKYGRGALNQHLFKVTSGEFPKWFYFYWTREHLPSFQQIATAKAVTMGHIKRHHLNDALIAIPDDNFMKIADDMFTPMLEKFISNNSQIQTLSALRDVLLPKLMNGIMRCNMNNKQVKK